MAECGRTGNTVIVRVPEALDMSNSSEFKKWLKENCIEEGVKKVILDFSGLQSIDSYALGILVSIQKSLTLEDGSLVIASPNDNIRRILEITSLSKIFKVVDSVDEAMEVE